MDLGYGSDWALKGEGNANAVFAYSGTLSALVGKVLRVRKVLGKAKQAGYICTFEHALWAPVEGLFTADGNVQEHVYVNSVMRRLIGPELVAEQVPVPLPAVLASHLLAELHCMGRRPGPTALSDVALLMPDHTLAPDSPGQALCVELKPKCGFLPSTAQIAPQHDLKKRVSRFQLHQTLKLSQGDVTQRSSYEPLDLFSGDPCRMKAALRALLATPQNNLRMFCKGQRLPEQDWEALLKNIFGRGSSGNGANMLVECLSDALLQSGILERILAVQQLDSRDIEGVYPVYCTLMQAYRDAEDFDERRCACVTKQEEIDSCSVLRNYLMAASAKDCSIMITLQVCDQTPIALQRQLPMPSKVAVVDLDFKPLTKVQAHFELDCKILAANAGEKALDKTF